MLSVFPCPALEIKQSLYEQGTLFSLWMMSAWVPCCLPATGFSDSCAGALIPRCLALAGGTPCSVWLRVSKLVTFELYLACRCACSGPCVNTWSSSLSWILRACGSPRPVTAAGWSWVTVLPSNRTQSPQLAPIPYDSWPGQYAGYLGVWPLI